MTVSSSTAKAGPYAGAGLPGPFTVPFRFLSASHLQVIRTSSSGLDTTLTLTADYTVSGVGASSGSVTLTAPLASGERLTIIRNAPFTQLADYVNNDAFPAESHEDALDLLTMQTQQLKERVDSALTLPATVTGVDTDLPTPESNKLIGWNEAANALQNFDATTLATIVAFGTSRADTFTGNGTQTQFALTANPGALANLDVAIGGVTQVPGIDYTFSGTTLTFISGAPANGVRILARYFLALPQGVTDSAASTFLQAGTGAVTRTAQAKMRDTVSVKDFGAVGDNVADDTAAIQAAIDALEASGGGELRFPSGTYKITAPLTVAGQVNLVGENLWSTLINKTTSTVGSGSNTARSGTITDTYAVDAVVILTHPNDGYNYETQIRNLTLKKNAYAASSYGIYAPRCTHFLFGELLILNCQIGYYTFDSWMSNLRNVTVQACAIGYQHADDGSGSGTGTSITFQNCWVNFDNTIDQPTTAFSLFGLTYSSLICCASDNAIRTDGAGIYNYTFLTCTGISMSGCGAENFKGGFIRVSGGHVSVTETRTFASTGVASGTVAMVLVDSSAKLTMQGCNFAVPTSVGVLYNLIIQTGAQLVEINPFASPSGGDTFASFSGGASRAVITSENTTFYNASGSYTLPKKVTGSNALVAATPQTIYTLTDAGAYYLYIYVSASGSAYRSVYLITTDGAAAEVTALKAGASLTISMSGLNVRATSAATAGASWTIIQQT
jgi:hypothetical protein